MYPTMATKNATIKFRLSQKEKRAIHAAAKREGLAVSAWLRQRLLRAAGALKAAKHVASVGRQ